MVTIRIDSQGNLWQAEYSTATEPAGRSLNVVGALPGPIPILARPLVLNADGKIPPQEPEKTFLQRYDIQQSDRLGY